MVIVTWVGEVGCASWKINCFFKGGRIKHELTVQQETCIWTSSVWHSKPKVSMTLGQTCLCLVSRLKVPLWAIHCGILPRARLALPEGLYCILLALGQEARAYQQASASFTHQSVGRPEMKRSRSCAWDAQGISRAACPANSSISEDLPLTFRASHPACAAI